MSRIVNVEEARSDLSRLLEQAHDGEEIIVAKAGKPYARLVPLSPRPAQRRPGRFPGRLADAFFEPLSPVELDAWEPR